MVREPLPIKIRDARESDMNYIYSSWRKSYQGFWWDQFKYWLPDCSGRKWMPESSPEFKAIYNKGIRQLFKVVDARQETAYRVAVDPEDDDFIIGWACTGGDVVYYCYVRDSFRLAGVAKRLLDGKQYECALWSKDGRGMASRGRFTYKGLGV